MATVNKAQYEELGSILGSISNTAKKQMDDNLEKFEKVDRYLEKASDLTKNTMQGEMQQQYGGKKITNIEIPIVEIKRQTAHAYLAGLFLTGSPIFAAVTDRSKEDGATMLNALTKRDQQRMGWVGELLRCFDDVLRRNICIASIEWKTKRATGVKTNIVEGVQKTGAVTPIVYEGVGIERWDPYNSFWDQNVEPSKLSSHGNYVGKVEVMDLVNLKRLYQDLNSVYTFKKNIDPILQGTLDAKARSDGYQTLYRVPQVSKYEQAKDPTNFSGFFGSLHTSNNLSNNSGYEVVTMYRRLIPEDYGFTTVQLPSVGNTYIFKLIWVNGYMCYAEPLTLGHEYLPAIVGQMYPGNNTKKSFCEYILDLQDMATSMVTATFDSMRRAVADRALYDPSRITEKAVNNPNPSAKIPVTGNLFQKGLADAYYPIPYIDNISPQFNGMMQLAFSLSDTTTGINPSSQGSFIPGNKTRDEFQTIMNNSDARLQLGALQIHTTFLQPIKEMVKILLLVNSINETIQDKQLAATIEVNMEVLRNEAPDYMMADGLMPMTKLANTDVLIQAMAAMQNDPKLNLEYDTGGILLSVLKQQGFNDINQYKRTPEEQQQYMALIGVMNGQPAPSAESGE